MSVNKHRNSELVSSLLAYIYSGYEHRQMLWGCRCCVRDAKTIDRAIDLGLVKMVRIKVSFGNARRNFLVLTPTGEAMAKIMTAPATKVPAPHVRSPRVEKKGRARTKRLDTDPGSW